ncbi:branched-chain amino acid ABC transporter permease [Azospirillum sp.]|uniref:branched-chain amino acid ABC transporter permease n=1 Tax=Azospirillum sp. TaxID=34012 RepID=UPI002D56E7A3|nr:branched-chain amino acid ABC transporter permease [Azospirillum sp.]HYD71137.1 branched-chain amino acid ABC transporter permease [Azospirillum sp.]HYH23211.1 branched-chain amino acid ABC transporter permease [Azospirillum sp.]
MTAADPLRHRLPAAVLVLIAATLLPILGPGSWVNTAIITLLFAYLCLSWNIVGGIAGQFCIGHSLFVAAGAYTSTLLSLTFGVTPWIGMFAGGAVAALMGVGIAWLSLRYELPPLSFALVTLALGMLGYLLASTLDVLGASRGLSLPIRGTPAMYQFRSDSTYYYVILAHLAAVLLFTIAVYDSRLGLYLRGVRDNERASLGVGIHVLRYKMAAMGISAFFTALGGTFYAQYLQFVEPHTFAGLTLVIEVILFTVVGGSGTIWGPLVGPLLLVPLGEALRSNLGDQTPGLHLFVYGVLLVAVIRFAPQGLVGLAGQVKSRIHIVLGRVTP